MANALKLQSIKLVLSKRFRGVSPEKFTVCLSIQPGKGKT